MHSRNQRALFNEYNNNENNEMLKKAIADLAKTVEQRVYWLNTAEDEGQFLQQYWDKQACTDQVLKKRLAKITQQKLEQLFMEVDQGKIQNNSELSINIFDGLKLKQLAEDIPVYDPSYFSANHPKTKQVQQKLRRIHHNEQRYKRKVNKMKEEANMKRMQEIQLRELVRESQEKEKKEKYKEKVMKTLEQNQKRKQYRDLQNQKFHQFLKAYKETKPLHQLMEQEYKNKFQLPMLEQNKRKLQQFKAKTKPTLQEINEHERDYLQQRQRRSSRVLIANHTIDVSFKSKFYLDEQRKLEERDHDYETLFDQMEKKKRYSEIVKLNFKPKISSRLRNSIAESTLKNQFVKQAPDRSVIIQRGKLYLQFMRSLEKKRKHSSPEQNPSQSKIHQSRYTNYLQDFKDNHEKLGHSRFSHDWQKQLKNQKVPEYDRRERVLLKSKLLEEKARMQQILVNNAKHDKAEQILEKKRQIDDTMIDAIRAKVAVLKDAQNYN